MGLLALSSCSVMIHDFTACSPLPGGLGATCDNFLTSNQRILDQIQWEAQQKAWGAMDCMGSIDVANLKTEIEKLCSKETCTQEEKKAREALNDGLERIQSISTKGMIDY